MSFMDWVRGNKAAPAPPDTSALTTNRFGDPLWQVIAGMARKQSKIRTYASENYCCDQEFENTTAWDFKWLYQYNGLAQRIVTAFPDATWRYWPKLYDGDGRTETPFEQDWNTLVANAQIGLPKTVRKLDKLMGIGHYGVMFFGLDDDTDPALPVERLTNRLLYLRPFDESLARVLQWDMDNKSPRFGQPILYNLTFRNAMGGLATFNCHYSRVMHVTENTIDSPVTGTPRMEPVLLRILQASMLLSGSAHMYMRGAFPGIALSADATQPDPSPEVQMSIRQQIDNYMRNLTRVLAMKGYKTTQLSPQVVDPTPQLDAQYTFISIFTHIPKRILMGTEEGVLAGGQDSDSFAEHVEARREGFGMDTMLKPLALKLAELGVIRAPGARLRGNWKDKSIDERIKAATLAYTRMQTLDLYCKPGSMAPNIMPEPEFFADFLDIEPEKIDALMAEMDFLPTPEPIDDVTPGLAAPNTPEDIAAGDNAAKVPAPGPR